MSKRNLGLELLAGLRELKRGKVGRVVVGTHVPFQTLVPYLEARGVIDAFPADFPTVPREIVIAALRLAHRSNRSRA